MSLQGLYTASATPVLRTGCTTRQGLAFSSSRKHDSCSQHIYTRLLRGIFLLPSPLKGHAAKHTVFMVQHMWEIRGWVHPPAHTGPAGSCPMDRRAGHPMATGGHIPYHHAHINLQLSLAAVPNHNTHSWAGHLQSHQTWAQTSGGSANDLLSPKKGRLEKSLCQREPMTDIPEQFCTFTALQYITSGIKWWKDTSAEQSQPCPPYLAAPPR